MEPAVAILLVEDEELIALAVQEALEDGGYAVRTVCNGAEALSVINGSDQKISGLITDIRLGTGPDGWELARRAREENPGLPVVYMTGDSAALHTSQGVPASLVVQKPFAVAQIVTAISTLLVQARPPTETDAS
jgi:CheY-like chemotaxis protein